MVDNTQGTRRVPSILDFDMDAQTVPTQEPQPQAPEDVPVEAEAVQRRVPSILEYDFDRDDIDTSIPDPNAVDPNHEDYTLSEQVDDTGKGVVVGGANFLRNVGEGITGMLSLAQGDLPGGPIELDVRPRNGQASDVIQHDYEENDGTTRTVFENLDQLPITHGAQLTADPSEAKAFDETLAKYPTLQKLARPAETLQAIADEYAEARSPEFKQNQADIAQIIDDADQSGGKFWGAANTFGAGVYAISTHPSMWMPMMGEVAGSMIGQVGGGLALRAVTGGAKFAGVAGAGVAGGLDAGGAAATENFQRLLTMEPAFYKASERYVDLVSQGWDDSQARKRLAYELSNVVRWSTASVTMFMAALPVSNRVDRMLGGDKLGTVGNRVASPLLTGTAEAGTEVVENEAANLFGNVAAKSLDESVSLAEGAGNSGVDAVMGFGAGAGIDIGGQLAGRVVGDAKQEANEKAAQVASDVAQAKDDTTRNDTANKIMGREVAPEAETETTPESTPETEQEPGDQTDDELAALAADPDPIEQQPDYAGQAETDTEQTDAQALAASIEDPAADIYDDMYEEQDASPTHSEATVETDPVVDESLEPQQSGVITNEVREETQRLDGQDPNSGVQENDSASSRTGVTESAQRDQGRPVAEEGLSDESGQVDSPALTEQQQRVRTQVRAKLDTISSDTAGRVVVSDDLESSTLSESAKQDIREQQADGNYEVPAFYDDQTGQIHVFSHKIKNERDVEKLIAHESVHAGLRDMFGDASNVRQSLESLFQTHPDAKAVMHRIARKSNMPVEAYNKAYNYDNVAILEEALAHAAENDAAKPAVKKFISAILQQLKKAGIKLRIRPDQTTEDALLELAREAQRTFYSKAADAKLIDKIENGFPINEDNARRFALRPVEDQITYYSALHKSILENLKQDKAPPQQMLQAVMKLKEVKPDEIRWTGLADWLSTTDKKRVTKQEMLDFLYEDGFLIIDQVDTDEITTHQHIVLGEWIETDVGPADNTMAIENAMRSYEMGDLISSVMDIDQALTDHIKSQGHHDALVEKRITHIMRYTHLGYVEGDATQRALIESVFNGYKNDPDFNARPAIAALIDTGVRHDEATGIANIAFNFRERNYASAMGFMNVFNRYKNEPAIKDKYLAGVTELINKQTEGLRDITITQASTDQYSARGNETNGYTVILAGQRQPILYYTKGDVKSVMAQKISVNNEYSATRKTAYTRHFQWIDHSGDFTFYREHLIILPELLDEYESPEHHFDDKNIVAFTRVTDRQVSVTHEGQTLNIRPYYLEEIQSDWHQHGRLYGYKAGQGEPAREGSGNVGNRPAPPVPFKGTGWIDLALRRSIVEAVSRGYKHIAWPNSKMMIERWPNDEYQEKFSIVYDKHLHKAAKQILKGTNSNVMRTDDGGFVLEISDKARGDLIKNGASRFALRPRTDRLVNQTTATRYNYQRSGLRGLVDEINRRYMEQWETAGRMVKRTRDRVDAGERKGVVDPDNDFYGALKRMPGKLMPEMDDIQTLFITPIHDKLQEHGIQQDEFSVFNYALHAPERNAELRAEFDMDESKSPSGMSDEESAAIKEHFRLSGQYDGAMEAVEIVQRMREQLINRAQESGLISEMIADEYREKYQYYVPLKGHAVTVDVQGNEVKAANPRKPVISRGQSITQKEFRKAIGRESLAFDPVATLMSDLSEKTIRAAKNEALQHFLRFVQQNPDPEQYKIYTDAKPAKKPGVITRIDPISGEKTKKRGQVNMTSSDMASQFLGVKYKGAQFYIQIADARLNDTLMDSPASDVNWLLNGLRSFNRFRSWILTSLSPIFAVRNYTRDVQTSLLKIQAEQSRDDGQLAMLEKGISVQFSKNLAPAGRSMKRVINGQPPRKIRNKDGVEIDHPMDVRAEQFIRSGGRVGFFNTRNAEQMHKDFKKQMTQYQTPFGLGAARRKLDQSLNAVEMANQIVENSIRLAAFDAALQQLGPDGKPILHEKQAADFARELTVDFNARGTQTTFMSSLILFFNPAVQGLRNSHKIFYGINKGDGSARWSNLNTAQKIALTSIGASVMYAHMMREHMGEDDDGEDKWDKIPSWMRATTLPFPNLLSETDDDFIPIPLTYGFNIFSTIGFTIEETLHKGVSNVGHGLGQISQALVDVISPVGVTVYNENDGGDTNLANTVMRAVLPEVLKPVYELAVNENYFGSSIYNEARTGQTDLADSAESRLSTGTGYKEFATWLNRHSGGTDYLPGAISVHPETLRYWTKYLTGGMGTVMIDQLGNNMLGRAVGEDFELTHTPLVGSFISEHNHYSDVSRFYNRANTLKAAQENVDDARAAGRDDEIERVHKRVSAELLKLGPLAKTTAKQMSQLRSERRRLISDQQMDRQVRKDRIKAIEDEIGLLADQFNKQYNETTR